MTQDDLAHTKERRPVPSDLAEPDGEVSSRAE